MDRLKFLIRKKQKLVRETNIISRELDALIVDTFGFHYSETDSDRLIDSLDYGTDYITSSTFLRIMMLYKTDSDKFDTTNWSNESKKFKKVHN